MQDGDPGGQYKQRLIDSKEKWAREGRHLTGATAEPEQRLPPGQRLVKNWPVLDLGVQPDIKPEDWSLTVDGLVENPVVWRWTDFLAQPAATSISDIHCVTAWSRYDNRWEGVKAAHVLSVVRPTPEARFVLFHSHDGYTANLPIERVAEDNVMLAHSWEGKPIPREHGGPVRMVVPRLYFWKSAKWLKRIEFLAEDRRGFWEERGYHNEGDPWKEQRYG
ncbi:MAG TPA: sulfite oxidase-like oxidoreductase [Azospirillaceae bacterium]|nr:sulfite oxidase-like oxidoreductase [Azospirillaceae bacterium]